MAVPKHKTMIEEWRPVDVSNGDYEVSNLGRVRSTYRVIDKPRQNSTYTRVSKVLRPADRRGYRLVALSIDFKLRSFLVHRLVAKAFIPNPENKPQVNHKSGDKNDNTVDNLEWCTHRENLDHAVLNRLVAMNNGEKNGNSKLTWDIVKKIKETYKPHEFGLVKTARMYGTSKRNVLDIIKGRIWRDNKR